MILAVVAIAAGGRLIAQADLPQLTQPVNDFAHVIPAANVATMQRIIQDGTGGYLVVDNTLTNPNNQGLDHVRDVETLMFNDLHAAMAELGSGQEALAALLALDPLAEELGREIALLAARRTGDIRQRLIGHHFHLVVAVRTTQVHGRRPRGGGNKAKAIRNFITCFRLSRAEGGV
jgi:hypothetical protein